MTTGRDLWNTVGGTVLGTFNSTTNAAGSAVSDATTSGSASTVTDILQDKYDFNSFRWWNCSIFYFKG